MTNAFTFTYTVQPFERALRENGNTWEGCWVHGGKWWNWSLRNCNAVLSSGWDESLLPFTSRSQDKERLKKRLQPKLGTVDGCVLPGLELKWNPIGPRLLNPAPKGVISPEGHSCPNLHSFQILATFLRMLAHFFSFNFYFILGYSWCTMLC